MQDMDREVLLLGRELAMCTLDMQLDFVFIALEDELRQIIDADASVATVSTGGGGGADAAGGAGDNSAAESARSGGGAGGSGGRRRRRKEIDLRALAPRRGSTEELSVLLAQYALLARRLGALTGVFAVCASVYARIVYIYACFARHTLVSASCFEGFVRL